MNRVIRGVIGGAVLGGSLSFIVMKLEDSESDILIDGQSLKSTLQKIELDLFDEVQSVVREMSPVVKRAFLKLMIRFVDENDPEEAKRYALRIANLLDGAKYNIIEQEQADYVKSSMEIQQEISSSLHTRFFTHSPSIR